MNKKLIAISLLILPFYLLGQDNTSVKYYHDIELTKETIEKKAKYKVVVSSTNEENSVRELFNIRTNKLIWHRSYQNNEPYGTWYYLNNEDIKTNSVVYGKLKPQGYYSYDLDNQELLENVEGEFSRPKLIGVDENIYSTAIKYKISDVHAWIAFNIIYPVEAQIDGIQGKVHTQFTIDDKGEIGNIRITKGVNEILDIESYRLLNSLPKMQPAKLNGKPVNLYIEAPLNFYLR
jgi:hypothetical protein